MVPAILTTMVLVACDEGSGPNSAEEALVTQDVAVAAAEATGDDIALMTSETDDAMDPALGSRCPRIGFKFRCAWRAFDDISLMRDVTFYDADGNEQDAYDADLTASINVVADFEGTRDRHGWTVVIERHRDVTVTGLAGQETERTWSGTGNGLTHRTNNADGEDVREYTMTANTTVDDVVIAVPRAGTWPLSGTITREVTVEVIRGLEDPTTRQRTVIIEFNGTQFVTMTVNGETFTLDLETRTIVEAT
jgi:hypothetical protein